MKKRTAILLLIAAVLLSVLSISVFAETNETPWYQFFNSITLSGKLGNKSFEYPFIIDHDSKSAVYYGTHSMLTKPSVTFDTASEGVTITALNDKGKPFTMLPGSINIMNYIQRKT